MGEGLTLLQSSSQKQAYSYPHTSHSHMKGVGGRVGEWERDLPSFRVLPKSKRTAVFVFLESALCVQHEEKTLVGTVSRRLGGWVGGWVGGLSEKKEVGGWAGG